MSSISVKLIEKKEKTMATRLAVNDPNGQTSELYNIGDVLYLKESCALVGQYWRYKSDYATDEEVEASGLKWLKPQKAPLRSCRLALEVKDVRLERLKDVRWCGIQKEGVMQVGKNCFRAPGIEQTFATSRGAYAAIWNKANAHRWKKGEKVLWRDNPLVWRISFVIISHSKAQRLLKKRMNNEKTDCKNGIQR